MNTELDINIRVLLLRMIKASDGPMPESSLKRGIATAYPTIAFPDTELRRHITDAEALGLLAGHTDKLFGPMWGLTPAGTNAAAQLH